MIDLLSLLTRRKLINALYIVLAATCFLVALVPLISILYQTILQGASAVNIAFFTQVTPPIGGAGGGILNAIEGSLAMFVSGCFSYYFIGWTAIPLALIAAIIESMPLVDDNLSIPIAATIVLRMIK